MPRGGKRRGAGRPRKNPWELQDTALKLNITLGQRERYQQAADLEPLDLNDWARKQLDAAATKALRPK